MSFTLQYELISNEKFSNKSVMMIDETKINVRTENLNIGSIFYDCSAT